MEKQNTFLTILKAFRLERPLIPISSIMLVAGFANTINTAIAILIVCCMLMYAVGGLINAKIDKDYEVKYFKTTIFFILTITLILSSYNYIILFTVLISFMLSFIYSKFSRFVLFGDSIVLAATHSTLPIISAALILNLNTNLTASLTAFMFFATALVVPMKNLNGVEDDIKRGYKTLMTEFKNGKTTTNILLDIYLVVLFLAYFIFNLGSKFLFAFAVIFIIKIFINYCLHSNKDCEAYKLARLIMIFFSFAVVLDKSTNISLIIVSMLLVGIYLIYLAN